ncbi:uncharacterized protein C3orf20-like [Pelodytes ibericus]
MVGTFTPFGHGSVCYSDSNIYALQYNQVNGVITNKEGDIVKEWEWQRKGKLSDPITLQVNEYLSIRILGQFSVYVIYKWQHETVRLSLSPVLDVSPPQLEDLGPLLTTENFTSRTARELCRVNRKKAKEKDTKRNPKKATILADLVKSLEIPEIQVSASSDFNAASELRKLQRKVRNIVDDWMEHYRLASGIDSPHIIKMSEAPPRMSRMRKVQSAAVLPVTSPDPKPQSIKPGDGVVAPGPESYFLHGRFQSAPAHTHLMHWDSPLSSPSPRPSSIRSIKKGRVTAESSLSRNVSVLQITNKPGILAVTPGPLLSGEQDLEKMWHLSNHACPVVLQTIMVGGEGGVCRCSNHQIPYITDLEYDQLINRTTHSDQITVVCVVSSLTSEEDQTMLNQLYERKNRYRSMPCMQGRMDSFRLLKYDITASNKLTGDKSSLLVQRHNVDSGMVLMYIRGKLLFANYIFNGYSRSIKNLQKQIAQTRSDFLSGYSLPSDFKFRRW